jgi:hypothetical protein
MSEKTHVSALRIFKNRHLRAERETARPITGDGEARLLALHYMSPPLTQRDIRHTTRVRSNPPAGCDDVIDPKKAEEQLPQG